jgi:hypothetical protein
MNIKNIPVIFAIIVAVSILLVVVGDGDIGSVGEYNYDNDKIIARSP